MSQTKSAKVETAVQRLMTEWPEIICPIDRLPLFRKDEHLTCATGHAWKVRQNIPRIIANADNYAEAFGLQWKVYRETQLDSHTGTTISKDRAYRCLGEEALKQLTSGAEMAILEVGCGAGRFTEVLLTFPGVQITSVDYSSAVEANQESFPQNDRHRIIQADVMSLPFQPEQYDVVFCLGVIQHTPDPERTIEKLYQQVKPGGWLIIDHYTYSLARLTKSSGLIRPILKRLPASQGLKCTDFLVKVFFPAHRLVRKSRLLQMALSRISPINTYFQAYPQLGEDLQYQWALLDTHDSLTDWYKYLRTRGQIRRTLENLGSTKVHCVYAGNGVEARCCKPER